MIKECNDNQIRNPASGRCVKKDSTLGKKLVKGEIPTSKAQKECPEGKVRNPTSGRCVKTNSKTLKKDKTIVKEDVNVSNIVYTGNPFDKSIALPKSEIDILSNVAYINKAIRASNKKSAIKNQEFFYDTKQYTPEEAYIKHLKSKRLTPDQRLTNIQDISKNIKNSFENVRYTYYDANDINPRQQILNEMRIRPLSQILNDSY